MKLVRFRASGGARAANSGSSAAIRWHPRTGLALPLRTPSRHSPSGAPGWHGEQSVRLPR